MKTRLIWDDLQSVLRNIGLELTQIDYTPGSPPEITAVVLGVDELDGIYFYSSEDCRTRFPRQSKRKPAPKKVIFSGPATTILWKDGTKTTVKCQDEDVWDDEVGIAMCYLKKLLGNKGNFNNIFREAMKVAEVQQKKEDLTSSQVTIEGESYYNSALNVMKQNIDEIHDFMEEAVDALDKALGGEK